MATLVIKSPGFEQRNIHFRLGLNRMGRSPEAEFTIEHPTISAIHCALEFRDGALRVRDCGSTNGTFVDGKRVLEATLSAGQILRLGDVELVVENAEVTIAIPKFDVPVPAPPVFRADGVMMCRRHEEVPATHRCTHCREVLCDACVHHLRRSRGKLLLLCPLCSHPCTPIAPESRQKKTIVGFLLKTVKMPFLRQPRSRD